MTHECGSGPFWRVFEDRGGVQMMPYRESYFTTEGDAEAVAARRSKQLGIECRAVQSCYVAGYPAVCGGPAAVKPSNPAKTASGVVQFGKPPVGGEE